MSIMEIVSLCSLGSAGVLAVILSAIQLSPAKVNPWSAIARALGKAINHDVFAELNTVKESQAKLQEKLGEIQKVNDARNADHLRERILRFNLELMRGEEHTREDYVEILKVRDDYKDYCESHPEYKNSRAELAIENISQIYLELMRKGAFFGDKKHEP